MRVHVRRSGGFAGLTLEGELDTAMLEPTERASTEGALAELQTTSDRPPPSGPDRYQYDLTISTDDGATRRVTLHEPDVPDDLRDLLTTILQRPRAG
jgi:hypothetical protein